MNNISKTALRVTSRAFYHFISVKLASYHNTHRTLKVFTATRQNKSWFNLLKGIVPEIGYITII